MELLFAALIALASGLAFRVFHQRRRLQALSATIHDRDIALGRLRSKLEKAQIENQATTALSAAICDFSFDIVLLLEQDLSIAMANGRARRLFRRWRSERTKPWLI